MAAKIYQFRKKTEPVAQAPSQDRLSNAVNVASTPLPPPVGDITSATWMLQFVDTLHANLEILGLEEKAKGMFNEITQLIVGEKSTRLSIKGVNRLPKGWHDFLDIQCVENGNPDANPANVRKEHVQARLSQFIQSWLDTQPMDPLFQLAAAIFSLSYFYEKGYWLMSYRVPLAYKPGDYAAFVFVHPKQTNVKYQIGIDLAGIDLQDFAPAQPG